MLYSVLALASLLANNAYAAAVPETSSVMAAESKTTIKNSHHADLTNEELTRRLVDVSHFFEHENFDFSKKTEKEAREAAFKIAEERYGWEADSKIRQKFAHFTTEESIKKTHGGKVGHTMGKVEVPKNSKAQELKKEFKAKMNAAATSSEGRKLYDDGDIHSGVPRHVQHNKGEQCTFIRLRSRALPTDWRTDMVMPMFPGDHYDGPQNRMGSWGIRLYWSDNTHESSEEFLEAMAIYFFEEDYENVFNWNQGFVQYMEYYSAEDKDEMYDCTPEWRVNGLLNMIYWDTPSCMNGDSSYRTGNYPQWWSAIGYTSPNTIVADAWQIPDFPPANGPFTKWGDQYEYFCPTNNGKDVIVLAHRTDKDRNCKQIDPEYSYWWTVTHGANCKRVPYSFEYDSNVNVGGLVFDTTCVMPPDFQYCPYSSRSAQDFIWQTGATSHCYID